MRPLRTVTTVAAVAALAAVAACGSNSPSSGAKPRENIPESAFKAGPINSWDTAGFKVDPATLKCSGKAPDPTRGITDTSVKVGGLGYLTSASGSTQAGSDVGAKVRFQRANDAGGVNGRKIDFIGMKDDGQDAARNVQQAQALVQQDHVFAVVPVMSSYPNYLDTLCKAVVPFFGWGFNTGFCDTAIGFGISGCLLPDPKKATQIDSGTWGMLVRALFKGDTKKTVAVIGQDIDSARTGVETIARQVAEGGFKIVYKQSPIPIAGLTDATPVVNAIMKSNSGQPPDLLISPVDFASTVKLTEAIKAAGYTGQIINASTYDPRLASFAPLDGSQTILQWAPSESSSAGMTQLKADFAKYAPDQVLSLPAMAGYWSADLFLAALRKTGRDVTVDSFLKALNGGDFTHSVEGALPATQWPLSHVTSSPCGTLVGLKDKRYTETVKTACAGLIKT